VTKKYTDSLHDYAGQHVFPEFGNKITATRNSVNYTENELKINSIGGGNYTSKNKGIVTPVSIVSN